MWAEWVVADAHLLCSVGWAWHQSAKCIRLVVKVEMLEKRKANQLWNEACFPPLACRPGPQPSCAAGLSCCTLHGTSWHLRHLWVFHLQEKNRSLMQGKQKCQANYRDMGAWKHDFDHYKWKCDNARSSKFNVDLHQGIRKSSMKYKSTSYGSGDRIHHCQVVWE